MLDRVVAEAFKANPKWGKRDRGFVAESVWEVVRWRRVLAYLSDSEDPRAWLAAEWWRTGKEVPEWWAWEGANLEDMGARSGGLEGQPRAVRESVPDWLDRRGEEEMGARWGGELAALNRRAPVFLRANRLLATRAEVREWLEGEGVAAREVAGAEDALELEGTLPKRLYGDGRIEIQDAGSQRIAPLLEAEPGMRVIDACAGVGGKTLHLAALMEGRGEIVALDISPKKLESLKRRAGRAGVRNVRGELWGEDTLSKYGGRADRVLVDAPCSGLGTLRRQPDLKWRLDERRLEKAMATQRELIERCAGFLRPGGKLVYATCSVLPCKNGRQLAGREIEEEISISPATTGWDGFYGARVAG